MALVLATWGIPAGRADEVLYWNNVALENGLSRIYGGIHYNFSNLNGIACGQQIGWYVFENCARPIPAPGAGLLAFLGAACLLRWRHRRRRAET